MLSSVFRHPMPLLLWNWSACRKKLLLYETLQHLWQFNLVYAQCNISPGILQNSPQTRLSSSLGVGLSLTIRDCSIKLLPGCYIQLPPISRTYSLLMLLKTISTSFRCFLQWQLKFFFHEWSPLKKVIAVNHFVYYCFNIIASWVCIPLIDFVPHHGVSPPNPAPIKQYTVTLGLYQSYTPGGWGWTLGFNFLLRSREFLLALALLEGGDKSKLLVLISKEDTN